MAGWNYRKRVKIAPGVTVNISKNGVSTSVGPKGARITYGKNGTYLNTSIPGTGLYRRKKIGESVKTHNEGRSGCLYTVFLVLFFSLFFFVVFNGKTILSYLKDYLSITILALVAGCLGFIIYKIVKRKKKGDKLSQEQGLDILDEQESVRRKLSELKDNELEKNKILSSYLRCLSILPQIGEAERILTELKMKKRKKYIQQIPIWEKKKKDLEKEFDNSKYSANDSLSEKHKRIYTDFCKSLYNLTKSSSLFEHWIIAKSIKIVVGEFNFIKNSGETPIIIREDGTQLYFYPSFIINAKSSTEFDIIWLRDIKIVTYDIEESQRIADCPKDALITSFSYTYENKDGSRDLRYRDNPLRGNVKYRVIKINEIDLFEICISNQGLALDFEKKIKELVRINDSNKLLINQTIYENFYIIIKRFFDIASWIKSNDECKQVLKEYAIDYKSLVNFLIERDLQKCLLLLGKKPDINKIEYFALGMLLQALDSDSVYYIEEYERCVSNVTDYKCQNSKEIIEECDEGFAISFLLNKVDKKRQIEYLILLHEFCKTIAETDNIISKEETVGINYISETISNENNIGVLRKHKLKPKEIDSGTAIDELQHLIGLTTVKEEISSLANFIKIQKIRQDKGLKVSPVSYHCVFTGNPGTGKTTIARIVARIYQELGILKKGHLVETDRSGLVAEYVGQTAVKTNKIIDEALDGVLFIDEAYALVDGGENDFGKEAISTLLKRMEDERSRLIVILAGYTNDMKRFIDSNPGLQSRFNRYIEFSDYTAEELLQIFELLLENNEYHISEEAKIVLSKYMKKCVNERDERFGNGRFVRNLFERTIEKQANRLSKTQSITADMLTTIEIEDLPE